MTKKRAHAGLPDVERLARKLDRQKATLADLCQLYRASSRLPLIQGALEGHAGEHSELLRRRWALFKPPLSGLLLILVVLCFSGVLPLPGVYRVASYLPKAHHRC